MPDYNAIVASLVADPSGYLSRTTISLDSSPVEKYRKDVNPAPVKFPLIEKQLRGGYITFNTLTTFQNAQSITDGLSVYFLPWERGRKISINFPPPASAAAKLIMTAPLTGCAVAYWLSPDGSGRFYHLNSGDGTEASGGNNEQSRHDRLAKSLGKAGGTKGDPRTRVKGGIFNTNNYAYGVEGTVHGCAYGILRDDTWEFYGQIVTKDLAGKPRAKSVEPFTSIA